MVIYACRFLLLAMMLTGIVAAPLVADGQDAANTASSAMKDYVDKPDDTYRWQKRREGALGAGNYVELTLTSQTWRDKVWKHQLFVYRPSTVEPGSDALLLIGGGRWRDTLEKSPHGSETELPHEAIVLATLAESLRAPVAVLLQVPHQPLFNGMMEDEIIAFTFEEYLKSGEDEWPLLLPMVKSAVRAMDAVQELAKSEWQLEIERFLVAGASKRGWTTWLTAAIDTRVAGIAPMVINMLNMAEHMKLQRLSYGTASEEIRDYTERGLHEHLHTEGGADLRAIVDPYSYRRELLVPKLIILGTNDRYWPVDALNLYWNELQGEKHILYVPNNGHSLRDYPRILGTVAALHKSLNGGRPLPKLEWKFANGESGLRLELSAHSEPVSVTAWTAAAETRDFRDATWVARSAQPTGDGGRSFVASLPMPSEGFAAMFVEAQFRPEGGTLPIFLSTSLQVVEADGAPAADK